MEIKDKVLEVMQQAGEPLNAGKIAELSGLDRKEVDKAMKQLKDEGAIVSPVRCKWEPAKQFAQCPVPQRQIHQGSAAFGLMQAEVADIFGDGLIGVIQNTTAPLWGLKRWCHCTYKGGEAPVRYIEPIGIEALTQQIYKLKGYKTNLPILFSFCFSELASAMPLHRHQHFQDKGGAPRGSYAHNAWRGSHPS